MTYRSASPRPLTAQGKKVVVFDRDETMTLILKYVLEKQGFSVYTADSVQHGMQLIQARKPQLLIWELSRRPEIDFDMLQGIQHLGGERPYVILVSTPETLNDDAPIESLGHGDVFIKPFEPGLLVRRVEWLVAHEKL